MARKSPWLSEGSIRRGSTRKGSTRKHGFAEARGSTDSEARRRGSSPCGSRGRANGAEAPHCGTTRKHGARKQAAAEARGAEANARGAERKHCFAARKRKQLLDFEEARGAEASGSTCTRRGAEASCFLLRKHGLCGSKRKPCFLLRAKVAVDPLQCCLLKVNVARSDSGCTPHQQHVHIDLLPDNLALNRWRSADF